MALTQQTLLEHTLGINTSYDWQIAAFYEGFDPLTDLANAEIDGTRTSVTGLLAWDTDVVTNPAVINMGPMPSASVGGWFIVKGAETDIAWLATFAVAVETTSGDYLLFDPGTINLSII